MPLPSYSWFDQVPEYLKTRDHLAELGLRPGGPAVARVVWRRWADLFELATAKPKRVSTTRQRVAWWSTHSKFGIPLLIIGSG